MDRKETELDAEAAKELSRSETKTDANANANARTEALLAQGDELFERGLLEQAIHLWTRVLFLDRGNREARGRIERAKSLLAERQRLLDARVVEARGSFEQGDPEEARALLRTVLNVDAHHADAIRLSEELAALERRGAPMSGATDEASRALAARDAPGSGLDAAPALEPELDTRDDARLTEAELRRRRFRTPKGSAPAPGGGLLLRVSRLSGRAAPSQPASPLSIAGFLLVVAVAFTTGGLFLYYNWESIVSDGTAFGVAPDGAGAAGVGSGTGAASEGLGERQAPAAPDLSELRYYNGARLFEKGRYREALAELERVDRGSTVATRARGLILRIEERLLRGVEETESESEPDPDPVPDPEVQER